MRTACFLVVASLLVATPRAQAQSEPPAEGEAPPPPTEAEVEPRETTATETGAPPDVAIRGLSWDILGGGIQPGVGILQADLGFSALPRVAYHHSILPNLSVGGLTALDYARSAPDIAFTSSLVLAGVIRYSVLHDEAWTIGLRGEPGMRIGFDSPFLYSFLLNLQGHVGYALEPHLIVGGGVDVPMEVIVPSRGNAVFSAPVLVGGFTEFHVAPQLALTADVKMGPHLNTSGIIFGMRVLAGLAVRL